MRCLWILLLQVHSIERFNLFRAIAGNGLIGAVIRFSFCTPSALIVLLYLNLRSHITKNHATDTILFLPGPY
jgi:hypothetical protein